MTGRDEDHTHGRHCGEIMAFRQYEVVHGSKDITSFEGEPRIVSVLQSKKLATRALKVHDPCGAASSSPNTDEAWGCNFFMKQRMPGVRVIPESQEGERYSLDNWSGGRPKISSIGVCNRAKAKRMDVDELGLDAPEVDMANTHLPVVDVLV
ncbi:hypothetical protein NLG97_g11213 [Lecanicillium saksenae]|uniref:Uncharacterized protein n=1 Tax=Lecanicillium saksenae TaxID=468837 RepID=A0ACC1QDZ4_9HYPO|nr:hypothetical protein NLG97_g11213 [Lecanicillium saksenae]